MWELLVDSGTVMLEYSTMVGIEKKRSGLGYNTGIIAVDSDTRRLPVGTEVHHGGTELGHDCRYRTLWNSADRSE